MNVAFLNTDSHPVKLKPLTKQLPLYQWKDELDYLEKEVVFYKKLLRMGIANGRAVNKPLLYSLLDGFSKYEEDIFPELHRSIDMLSSTTKGENENVLLFHNTWMTHRIQLRKMKLQFFPLFSELQFLTIW